MSKRLYALGVFLVSVVSACATYTQDLERGRKHYEANQYEEALALFRVLEPDIDSLTIPERTEYAYLRGMTDYRLSHLRLQVPGVGNPKEDYRQHARHWLGLAAALEKEMPGALSEEKAKRLEGALEDLNKDVFLSSVPTKPHAESKSAVP